MKVLRGSLPANSLIIGYLPADYTDVFECTAENAGHITPDDFLVAFWTQEPWWLKTLFKLRNLLVKPFGLKGDSREDINEFENHIRTGGHYSMINIPPKRPNETVMELNDKHLKAMISVHIEELGDNKRKLRCSTVVQFHNKLGVVYFFVIRPFHYVIVKSMVGRLMRIMLEEKKGKKEKNKQG